MPSSRRSVLLRGVLGATAVVATSIVPLFLTGVLSVQLREDVGLTRSGLGLVFAAFFGCAAASSTVLGRVTEKLGARRSLRLGGFSVAVVAVGVATLVETAAGLVVAMAATGVGSALTRPAAGLWIARAIPWERQGLAFGINHSAVPVASLLAGVAVPTLGLPVGWRSTYVAAAGLAVAAVFVVPPPSKPVQPAPPRRGSEGVQDLPRVLLVGLALAAVFGTSGASSLGAFTAPTMIAGGVGQSTAATVIAVSSLFGLVSRVGVGYLADRRSATGLIGVAVMNAAGALAFALLATGRPGLLFAGVPVAFATAWGWLGLFSLSIIRLNPGAPGTAIGIIQAGAFVGGVAGPYMMGVVAERFSFAWSWMLVAALALVATAAMVVIERAVRGRIVA